VVAAGVREGILGETRIFPQSPENNAKSNLGCPVPPVAPCLARHVRNILLLTTIVRPTYSVYHSRLSARHSSLFLGVVVSSSLTTRLSALQLSRTNREADNPRFQALDSESDFSDETLLALVCQGESEALALLFRRYARAVRGVALRILKDSAEAEDLLQDVFVLIHSVCRTFDGSKGPAQFWILQMAYRRAISRRRYLHSRHFYTRVDLDDQTTHAFNPQSDDDDVANSRMLAELDLQKLFADLSEDQQKTLRLHFIEGYTLDEIAKMLGQTKGNVRHHSFRGLERLRKLVFAGKLPDGRAV
jgi:RNA polymerase sigma-70 factor, ECF subfamily